MEYKEHRASLSSVRAGNVIGGGDWAEDRLIPDCIRSLVNEEPIGIRNPHSIRPWQHVLEPLRGYLTLAVRMWEKGDEYASGWNFGPSEDDAVPVNEIVQRITGLGGAGQWEDRSGTGKSEPHEANYLKLNICKARHVLRWKPFVDLDRALEMTVSWYKQYYKIPEDISDYSLKQLNSYTKIASKEMKP